MPLDEESLPAGQDALVQAMMHARGLLHTPDASPSLSIGSQTISGFPAIRTTPEQLFDYSKLSDVPNVPQYNLPRYDPPQGVPKATQALASPSNLARVNEAVGRGAKQGGLEWYNTEPLLHSFIDELGPKMGPKAYSRFIDYVAATSPTNKVMPNARSASYMYHADAQGIPLPEVIMGKKTPKLKTPLPNPYGAIAQALHVQNVNNIMANNGWMKNVYQNPKPASFAENLRGNQMPVTIDRHNARLIGLGKDVPNDNEYGFLERMQQDEAAKLGMTPAQYQASAWIGGGKETGLKSSADPFLKTIEDRIGVTAKKWGLSKPEVLRRMIRGEIPLSMNTPADAPSYG